MYEGGPFLLVGGGGAEKPGRLKMNAWLLEVRSGRYCIRDTNRTGVQRDTGAEASHKPQRNVWRQALSFL